MKDDIEYRGSPWGGLSHREIAALLGISHVRVGVIERRAMKKLRALLEEHGWEPEDLEK